MHLEFLLKLIFYRGKGWLEQKIHELK